MDPAAVEYATDAIRCLDKGVLGEGHRIFGLDLGGLKMVSFGKVVQCAGCVGQKRVYPVDFHSLRLFKSWAVEGKVWYICKTYVVDEAMVYSVMHPDGEELVGNTLTALISMVLNKIADTGTRLSKRATLTGQAFFGFTHPIVTKVLTHLPGYSTLLTQHYGPTTTRLSVPRPPEHPSKQRKITLHPTPPAVLMSYPHRQVDLTKEKEEYLAVLWKYCGQ
eukprot:TRINITY_DN14256_c0_g1_i1.p1 TRINITY_DN14256_c0_g1~~TRINITY_DN14256_c0_g1_i1.p1  ORF type:complete len:220 (+),score=47.95 TRINITY_DN14256_c0_g1_i1:38-697(+)